MVLRQYAMSLPASADAPADDTTLIVFDPERVVRGIVHHLLEETPETDIDFTSVAATLRRLNDRGFRAVVPRSVWASMSDIERLRQLLTLSGACLRLHADDRRMMLTAKDE